MVISDKAFQCQQCGGSASPVPGREYLQCQYCQSLVFKSENPLTIDRVIPMGGEIEAACPTCRQTMCKGKIEDRPVLFCGGCYGLLLKNEDFGVIVRRRRGRREGCEREPGRPLATEQYQRQICCPNCRSQMEVHPYYGPGNIVIDSCYQCQYIWLDHGELRTVERAEGGPEPRPLPLHVNSDGDVTIIPPPPNAEHRHTRDESPLSTITDLLFGLS